MSDCLYPLLFTKAKLLGVFIAFGVSDGKDRPTTILMILFAVAVAEVLLLVPAYIKLFDGLTYVGTREDGIAVFRKPKSENGKRSYTDSIKRSTVSFVIRSRTAAETARPSMIAAFICLLLLQHC